MNKFKKTTSGFKVNWIFLFILLIAAVFRLYKINWDSDFHFHPDERMITMVAERIILPQNIYELFTPQSPLNPNFFAYGSFPIYFLKFLSSTLSLFNPAFSTYQRMNLVGRVISATSDLGTILVIYLIGKRIWGKQAGLYASIFYSLSVFPIQAAHFYAVDSLLSFFIVTTLYRLIVLYKKPSFANSIWVGIFFGLALATKISATVLLASIGVALMLDLFLIFLKRVRQIHISPKIHKEFFDFIVWILSAFRTPKRQRLIKILLTSVNFGSIILFFTLITFAISEPYALIDYKNFIRQTLEQHQMTKSAYTFPYTLQYVATTPYLYQIKNVVFWGMGIPLGILSIVATVWLIVRLIKEVPRPGKENQEAKTLIIMSFFIVYFFVVGKFAIKFIRYMLPLYGIFSLFSAYFINYFTKKSKKNVNIVRRVFIFVVLTSFIWTLSFLHIYSKPQTRISATQWMIQNIPAGSKIAVEHWDDRVPLTGNYQFLEMPMYDPDSSSLKWITVNNNLAQADYLVLASNRLYTPLQKLDNCNLYLRCYPLTSKYYQKLFKGKLGFTKVAEFSSYPTIPFLNIKIADDSADESFTVYDHPKILVFKKTQSINEKAF